MSQLNTLAMDMGEVTTLSNIAYCITYKDVGLTWTLQNNALAKDLARA